MRLRYEKAGVILARSRRFNDLATAGIFYGASVLIISLFFEDAWPAEYTGSVIMIISVLIDIYSSFLLKKVDRILSDE